MKRSMDITEIGDSITVKEVIPSFGLYSPIYIVRFNVVERHDTPFLNGVRRWFGLDSAEYHTTMVHDSSYVGSVSDTSTRQDENAGLSRENLDTLDKKGYEIISMEEVEENYELGELPTGIRMDIKRKRREEKRRKREKERIERYRDNMEDHDKYEISDCEECPGFFAIDPEETKKQHKRVSHNRNNKTGRVFRGKVVATEHHMDDCDYHPMNRRT